MAKNDSSVFKYGYNKVTRRVVVPNIKAATSFDLPAGAVLRQIYSQNETTTASNLTVGNAAAGAQYLASTATVVSDANGPGITANPALAVAVSKVDSKVHITLSAYPIKNPTAPVAKQKGGISVVVEYDELLGSLDLLTQNIVRAY